MTWYLENGCSYHVIGKSYIFLDLQLKKGGNQHKRIIGTGQVGLKPSLSISQLRDKRCDVVFNKCIINKNDETHLVIVKRQSNLYKIDMNELTT